MGHSGWLQNLVLKLAAPLRSLWPVPSLFGASKAGYPLKRHRREFARNGTKVAKAHTEPQYRSAEPDDLYGRVRPVESIEFANKPHQAQSICRIDAQADRT